MNKAAILHVPKSQYSFAYGKKELRIRLRAAKSELDKVEIIYAVKYDWLKDRKTKVMQNSYSDALYDYAKIFREGKELLTMTRIRIRLTHVSTAERLIRVILPI